MDASGSLHGSSAGEGGRLTEVLLPPDEEGFMVLGFAHVLVLTKRAARTLPSPKTRAAQQCQFKSGQSRLLLLCRDKTAKRHQ